MKPILACLPLLAIAFSSCEKADTSPESDSTKARDRQAETRSGGSAPDPAAAESNTSAGAKTPPETRTPEDTIADMLSNGIPGIPPEIAANILRNSESIATPDERLRFITEQSEAWRYIDGFRERTVDMPDHIKADLREKLAKKHGESWKDMAAELDEQLAASAKVMELRLSGIPGMDPDASQDLLIRAIEKHGGDYKAILAEVPAAAAE